MLLDEFAEFLNPFTRLIANRGFPYDLCIFPPQILKRIVRVRLVDMGGDENDFGFRRTHLNIFEPAIQFALLPTVPRIPNEEEQGAVAKKEGSIWIPGSY